MRKRKDILEDLIHFNKNLDELENELSYYEWDTDNPMILLNYNMLANNLKKFKDNIITFDDLEKWANIVECRDDIDFEDDYIHDIISEIANYEINGIPNEKTIADWLKRLEFQIKNR